MNDSCFFFFNLTLTRMCTVVSNVSLNNICDLDTVTASGKRKKKKISHVSKLTHAVVREILISANSAENHQFLLRVFEVVFHLWWEKFSQFLFFSSWIFENNMSSCGSCVYRLKSVFSLRSWASLFSLWVDTPPR